MDQLNAFTVLVVDDHPVVRRGLVALLSGETQILRVLEASTVSEAMDVVAAARPDITIVDLALPDGDGIDLIRQILAKHASCGVMVLTLTREKGSAAAAMRAGARGYPIKDAAPQLLINAVLTVAAGGQAFSADIDVKGDPAKLGGVPSPFDRLTPRELELVRYLAAGRSSRQISNDLSVAEKTVRNQLSMIVAKVGVADRVQLALLAQRCGIS